MEIKDIALRVSMLREAYGESAREMSLGMGQNENYINSIENRKTVPSLQGLFFICEHLHITPAEFFDTENKNPEKLKAITENLKKLNDSQLEIIEKLTNELAKK